MYLKRSNTHCDAILGKQLWGDASQGSKHGPPTLNMHSIAFCTNLKTRPERIEASASWRGTLHLSMLQVMRLTKTSGRHTWRG